MKQIVKNVIVWFIGFVIFSVVCLGAFLYATSAEVWYAGEHDSKCEMLNGAEECHCCERLVEAEKQSK